MGLKRGLAFGGMPGMGLKRRVAFGGMGLKRGVAFGGMGLKRGLASLVRNNLVAFYN
jgi:hypothetical protein